MTRLLSRITVALTVPLLLATAGCSQAGRMDHGKVFADSGSELAVKPGQTFSIHWQLAVVPGNDWKTVPPAADQAVASFVGEDRISGDGSRDGDGGELYLVFRAGAKGSTQLVVENCFTCDESLRDAFHRRTTYQVTVG